MARTFRRSNADNRTGFDNPKQMGANRDGCWNGRFSREQEERLERSRRGKRFDKREISLALLES